MNVVYVQRAITNVIHSGKPYSCNGYSLLFRHACVQIRRTSECQCVVSENMYVSVSVHVCVWESYFDQIDSLTA